MNIFLLLDFNFCENFLKIVYIKPLKCPIPLHFFLVKKSTNSNSNSLTQCGL